MQEKIIVAVIDSGVDKTDGMLCEHDIEDLYYEDREIKECYGGKLNMHGTEIIKVLIHEAPGVYIISIRALNVDNKCSLTDVINSIRYCIGLKVDIINLSLGSCMASAKRIGDLKSVCDEALNSGIAIFAADNNFPGKKSYPANFENVVGVNTQEGMESYCIVSYQDSKIEFSENLVFIPDESRCIIRKGNSYLCPLVVGLYCQFISFERKGKNDITGYMEFLNKLCKGENISNIYFNKHNKNDIVSVNGKKILYFADDMDINNRRLYETYKNAGDVTWCFGEIYGRHLNELDAILKDTDIFLIGALSNSFIVENKDYINKLVLLLIEKNIEIITVFPVINTYNRIKLTMNSRNKIRSIYK